MSEDQPAAAVQSNRARAWAFALVPWLLAAALLWVALPGMNRLMVALDYPYQLDGEEGFILNQALRIKAGASIYTPIDQPPFLVGNYTPLLPWFYAMALPPRAAVHHDRAAHALADQLAPQLPAPLLHAFVAAIEPTAATLPALPTDLRCGRMLMLMALAFAMAGMGLVMLSLADGARVPRSQSAGWCVLAPLLLLASYEALHWSAFVRVDLPALALSLTALAMLAQARQPWHWSAAGLLCCAAVYTRQTAVLAPAAVALALVSFRQWRTLALFVIPPLVVGLIALVWLQITTGGEFLRHVIAYNANRMDWGAWRLVMRHEVWFFARCLLLAALPALLLTWLPAPVSPTASTWPQCAPHMLLRILGLYALLAVASLPGMAKVGSAPNYVLEPLAAGALWLVATMIAYHVASPLESRGRACVLRLCTLLLVCGLVAHTLYLAWLRPIVTSSATPTQADRVMAGRLVQDLQRAPAPILCEEPIFTLLAEQPVLHQPFIMAQLAREGAWDPSPLEALLRAGAFAALVVNDDLREERPDYQRWTPALAAAIRGRYTHVGAITLPGVRQVLHVWQPRAEVSAAIQ